MRRSLVRILYNPTGDRSSPFPFAVYPENTLHPCTCTKMLKPYSLSSRMAATFPALGVCVGCPCAHTSFFSASHRRPFSLPWSEAIPTRSFLPARPGCVPHRSLRKRYLWGRSYEPFCLSSLELLFANNLTTFYRTLISTIREVVSLSRDSRSSVSPSSAGPAMTTASSFWSVPSRAGQRFE